LIFCSKNNELQWFDFAWLLILLMINTFIDIHFVDFVNTDRAGMSTKFGGTCNGSTTKFLFRGTY
jgi:hypothetical protein